MHNVIVYAVRHAGRSDDDEGLQVKHFQNDLTTTDTNGIIRSITTENHGEADLVKMSPRGHTKGLISDIPRLIGTNP